MVAVFGICVETECVGEADRDGLWLGACETEAGVYACSCCICDATEAVSAASGALKDGGASADVGSTSTDVVGCV